METKDLIIVVLAVIVVLLAIISVVSLLGGNENLDETNVTDDINVADVYNQDIVNKTSDIVKNVTPSPIKKNTTEPYLVKKVWSEQQEGYLYYYSDGKIYNDKGQRVDNIS